ncbi:MAG: type II secretion system protein GspC, partial [Pseudomonadota bacterium]
APVPTSLPLNLVGTIIHGRDERSVATIQVKGKDIQAVMVGEELDGMAEIKEITRYKVIFRNLRNRKLEYVEIKEESKIKMGVARGKSGPKPTVAQPAQTNFTFKRSEVNKYLENLPKVLQDAKAVPYVAPGSGGEVSGFKLVAIKSGSIYEKLGLKRGDVIKGVNGEPVDSPQKAMELYQALKSSDQIQLDIGRGGSNTTLNYSLE